MKENIIFPQTTSSTSPSAEEQAAYMDKYDSQPWARISYHKELNMSMGMNMVRDLLVDMLTAFLLSRLFLKFADLNMKSAVISSVFIGLIGYLTINYLNSVWFETNNWPELIDAVAQWGLVGVWLGWNLNR